MGREKGDGRGWQLLGTATDLREQLKRAQERVDSEEGLAQSASRLGALAGAGFNQIRVIQQSAAPQRPLEGTVDAAAYLTEAIEAGGFGITLFLIFLDSAFRARCDGAIVASFVRLQSIIVALVICFFNPIYYWPLGYQFVWMLKGKLNSRWANDALCSLFSGVGVPCYQTLMNHEHKVAVAQKNHGENFDGCDVIYGHDQTGIYRQRKTGIGKLHKMVIAILTVKRYWKFRKSQLQYQAHLAPSCWPPAAEVVPVGFHSERLSDKIAVERETFLKTVFDRVMAAPDSVRQCSTGVAARSLMSNVGKRMHLL